MKVKLVTIADNGTIVLHLGIGETVGFWSMSRLVDYCEENGINAQFKEI